MHFPWKKGNLSLVAYFGRGRYLRFLTMILATGMAVVASFVTPQVIRITVDSVLGDEPLNLPAGLVSMIEGWGGLDFLRRNIWICALATLLLAALAGLFNLTRRYTAIEPAEHLARSLRNKLYDYIQRLPYDWHVKIQTGDIIQRCTSDVEMLKNFISNQLPEFIRIAFIVCISLPVMFSMDVRLTLISLSLIPLIFLFSFVYYAKVSARFKTVEEAEGALQSAVQENLTGVRVVRAFGRERYEMDRFDKKNERFMGLAVHLNDLMAFYWSFGDLMTGLQLIIVVVAGIFRCSSGAITLGTFLTFYSYSSMLIWPVRALGRMISELGKTRISCDRLRDILSTPPESEPANAQKPEIRGEITFRDVTFAYGSGSPVLKNVSFRLKAGTTMAVLGGTGSGKSTLTHLICRLYDVPEGSGCIELDGVDIRRMDRRWVRKNVGLVLQEPFLFSKTIRENISASDPAAELESVRMYAGIAAMDESILSFPDGYETVVGERGITLSGGQKQRVAIARMLMQNAPIMIFDDSLSAVDAETDAQIRNALAKHRKGGATTLIISHRISTLMQADVILVLRNGEIEQMGSHEELLRQEGTYRRIYELQSGGMQSGGFAAADAPAKGEISYGTV